MKTKWSEIKSEVKIKWSENEVKWEKKWSENKVKWKKSEVKTKWSEKKVKWKQSEVEKKWSGKKSEVKKKWSEKNFDFDFDLTSWWVMWYKWLRCTNGSGTFYNILISEVKQPLVGLVLGWVTAWESPVQYPFFQFFSKLLSDIGHLFGDLLGHFQGLSEPEFRQNHSENLRENLTDLWAAVECCYWHVRARELPIGFSRARDRVTWYASRVELLHIGKAHLHGSRSILGDGREARDSISSFKLFNTILNELIWGKLSSGVELALFGDR